MTTKQVRIGVGAIIEKDTQILLLCRASPRGQGTWSPPGGHLEYGETIRNAVIREVLEETSLETNKLEFLGLTNDYFKDRDEHYITVYYRCKPTTYDVKLNFEHTEFGWFSMENLPEPRFLSFQNYLENLIKLF